MRIISYTILKWQILNWKKLLVEKHLISPVHAIDNGKIFIDDNENISIMVNEEDHIRLQVLTAGSQLKEA